MLLLISEVWAGCWESVRLRVGWSAIFHSPSMKTRLTDIKHFCVFTLKSRYKLPKLMLRFRSITNSSTPMLHSITHQMHSNKRYHSSSCVRLHCWEGPAERCNGWRCVQDSSSLLSPLCVLEDLKRQLKASRYSFVFTLHPPSIPSPRFSER